jgi:hypothetical protein
MIYDIIASMFKTSNVRYNGILHFTDRMIIVDLFIHKS